MIKKHRAGYPGLRTYAKRCGFSPTELIKND
jgi:hypothetical protein